MADFMRDGSTSFSAAEALFGSRLRVGTFLQRGVRVSRCARAFSADSATCASTTCT